mmetsp:Transcript_1753/g.2111  ORF Transcript_1753/g.2111 Transcript_1753/m.2111 type:complete len:109 (+) Transcript_1753:1177-1503(+)
MSRKQLKLEFSRITGSITTTTVGSRVRDTFASNTSPTMKIHRKDVRREKKLTAMKTLTLRRQLTQACLRAAGITTFNLEKKRVRNMSALNKENRKTLKWKNPSRYEHI